MKQFSLDHLTPTDFEEFCYELLESLGATRMNWRKGTGYDSSPADQGRDIECFFERQDIDGHKSLERWFVECKHYKGGVPPDKLQGALAWANAEPDVLLIITSNFLSNAAKTNLESFQRNNGKNFKLKIWERKDIEKSSSSNGFLLRKYNLAGEFKFLELLHPAHLEYLQKPPINTLEFFFKLLDDLETRDRNTFFGVAFLHVINPTSELPPEGDDLDRLCLGDLLEGKVNYAEFRKKCLALDVSGIFLIRSIMMAALQDAFRLGDETRIAEWRANALSDIECFKEELRRGNKARKAIERCIKRLEDTVATLEQRTKDHYATYCSLCEKIIIPLLGEELPFPDNLPPQEYE